MALRNSNCNVRMHGTDRRFNTRTEAQSRSPSSFNSVLHWSGSRLSKTSASLFHFQVHQLKQVHNPCADNLRFENQLTWLVLVTRVHTSQRPVAALGIRAVCFLLAAPSPAVGPRWTPCNVHVAVACRYCSGAGRCAVPLAFGRGTHSSDLASFR